MREAQETAELSFHAAEKPSVLSIVKYTLWGGFIGFLYHFVAIALHLALSYLLSMIESDAEGPVAGIFLWHFALSPASEPNQLVFMGWMLSGFAGLVAGGIIGVARWCLARVSRNPGGR